MSVSHQFNARQDERQFRWAYAIVFVVVLIPAALSRLARLRRGAAQEPAQTSIITLAKARTSRIVPFFFMG